MILKKMKMKKKIGRVRIYFGCGVTFTVKGN